MSFSTAACYAVCHSTLGHTMHDMNLIAVRLRQSEASIPPQLQAFIAHVGLARPRDIATVLQDTRQAKGTGS